MPLTIAPITPAIGAVVGGIDLAQPLDAVTHATVEAALLEHQVLFFLDQQITQTQQRDLAALFGPLHIHPIYPHSDSVAEIMILDTDLNDLADNALWHSDVSFSETPPLGSVLVARVLPEVGGDTLWTSATAAYSALPEPLKQLIGGLTATHDLAKSFPPERFGADAQSRERLEQAKRNNPPVTHPVVRTHPVTGLKAIYVNEGFTTHIDGLPQDASDSLLGLLFRHVIRPEFSVRWRWQPGDVAIWDNRVTQHYATDDYRPHRRVMHRATMIGDRPF
ncbi:taurine dioxygenase [Novosphingobium sp. FKTRR1]|uniref:taurine dioxygenase n=1 Tax=Novosphingobium sp. FKTRR1 TaxID=2879118 RepID=UPI001CF0AD4A|nr:taurine dioxygenase [Novosphingobium sp. FKTRR1]